MFNPLDLTLKPLEYSINFALSLDPQTKSKLSEFENKTMSFIIIGIPYPIFITGKDQRFCLSLQSNNDPQTTISGSMFAFLRVLMHKNALQELSNGDLQLIGNSDLAEKLFALFGSLDIDWEEQLSKLVGDIPANSFYSVFQQTAQWGRDTIKSFATSANEFFQEEISIIAPIAAINDFIKDVDILRDDVERLSAHVQRLQTALQPTSVATNVATTSSLLPQAGEEGSPTHK